MYFYKTNKAAIQACEYKIAKNKDLHDTYNFENIYADMPNITKAIDLMRCPNHILLSFAIIASGEFCSYSALIDEIKKIKEDVNNVSKKNLFKVADLFEKEYSEFYKKIYNTTDPIKKEIYKKQFEEICESDDIIKVLGLKNSLEGYNLSKILVIYMRFMRFKYISQEIYDLQSTKTFEEDLFVILAEHARIIMQTERELSVKQFKESAYECLENKYLGGLVDIVKQIIRRIKTSENRYISLEAVAERGYQQIISLLKTKEYKKITNIEPYESMLKDIECDISNYFINRINANILREHFKSLKQYEELTEKVDSKKVESFIASLSVPLKMVEPTKRQILNRVNDLDLCTEISKFLISIGVNNIDLFTKNWFYIIINADRETFMVVKKYYETNVINKDFIHNNPGILLNKIIFESTIPPIFNTINSNVNYLKKRSFPFDNVNYEPELLLKEESIIERNIKILKPYNLSANNYTFLINNIEYVETLDLMIEHDIPLYLLKVIALSYDYRKVIKKIVTAKNIGFPYLKQNGLLLEEILENRGLLCDKNIDEMIFDSIPKYDIKIELAPISKNEYLDKNFYEESSNCYVLGTNKISRNKVLRLLSNGYDLKTAILYNSILSESDIEEINSYLKSISSPELKKLFN